MSAAATAAWTLRAPSRPGDWHPRSLVLLVVVSLGGLAAALLVGPLRRALSGPVVVGLSLALLVVTVIPRPHAGADMWVYATYGRLIVEHGESPYVHTPGEHPDDPFVRANTIFRDKPAVYGPLFIGMTAAVAAIAQEAQLAVRLAYQLGGALAVAACLLLLRRAGATPAALAVVGLNPVMIAEVVTEGHNDTYVGLCLLAAGVLAAGRRLHLAALAIALAALIKLPAALALGGLALWVWRHDGLRRSSVVVATGAIAVVTGYVVAVGPGNLGQILDAGAQVNDASVWVPFRENGVGYVLGDFHTQLGAPPGWTTTAAVLAGLVLATLLTISHLDDHRPELVVVLPVVAFLLTSPYPSPWYVAWVLPALGLALCSRATQVVVVVFALLLVRFHHNVALHFSRGATNLVDFLTPLESDLYRFIHVVTMLTAIAGVLVLSVHAIGGLRRGVSAPGDSFVGETEAAS